MLHNREDFRGGQTVWRRADFQTAENRVDTRLQQTEATIEATRLRRCTGSVHGGMIESGALKGKRSLPNLCATAR